MRAMRRMLVMVLALAACGGPWWSSVPTSSPPSTRVLEAVPLGTRITTDREVHVVVRSWKLVERGDAPRPGTRWSHADVEYCSSKTAYAVRGSYVVSSFVLDMPSGPHVSPEAAADEPGEIDTQTSALLADGRCLRGNALFAVPEGQRPVNVLFTLGATAYAWSI